MAASTYCVAVVIGGGGGSSRLDSCCYELIASVGVVQRYILQAAQFKPNDTIPISLCLSRLSCLDFKMSFINWLMKEMVRRDINQEKKQKRKRKKRRGGKVLYISRFFIFIFAYLFFFSLLSLSFFLPLILAFI